MKRPGEDEAVDGEPLASSAGVLRELTPRVPGPPWIVGWRGSPLEAPENTRSSLERAIALELDGLAYDLRACRGGELVLHADLDLERTTSGRGRIAERSWTEIAELDAGGWFGARFRGERLMLLEEALSLPGLPGREALAHVLLLGARVDLARIAALARELAPRSSIRVASADRELCLDARDAGLAPLLISAEASESDRRFVAAERITACGATADAWTRAASATWECERWMLAANAPADLHWAARVPFHGVLTAEPLRAHAARSLAQLAPASNELDERDRPDGELWPVRAPVLFVEPEQHHESRASWWGSWRVEIALRNPFAWRARATLSVLPRRGAFDIRGVPVAAELEPGAELRAPIEITGGAWQPGGDPLAVGSLRWRAGPGRTAGRLLFDAPLERQRRALADALPVRLSMLREAPDDADATMVVRRRGSELLVSVERTGGLSDVRALACLDGRVVTGARGLRIRLPRDFDARLEGVRFSCGFHGMSAGERRLRRFAGGLPDELSAGPPGRLLPWTSAATR